MTVMPDLQSLLNTLDEAAAVLRAVFCKDALPRLFLQTAHAFLLDDLFDTAPQHLPFDALPVLPRHPTPDNHAPVFLYGQCRDIPILVAHGHRHFFEGLGTLPCIFPTLLAWRLNIRKHLYVDPVLSLQSELKTGTWTLLTDFINGNHVSPLDGLQPLLSTPFPDMSNALSQHLNSELVNAMATFTATPRLCIYQSHPGSHFCTQAEAFAALNAKADIIGHDLVFEITTAHALDCSTAAMGLVAEQAPYQTGKRLSRQSVLDTCTLCSETLVKTIRLAIADITEDAPLLHQANLPEATADELLFADFKRPAAKQPALKHLLPKRD